MEGGLGWERGGGWCWGALAGRAGTGESKLVASAGNGRVLLVCGAMAGGPPLPPYGVAKGRWGQALGGRAALRGGAHGKGGRPWVREGGGLGPVGRGGKAALPTATGGAVGPPGAAGARRRGCCGQQGRRTLRAAGYGVRRGRGMQQWRSRR